MSSLFGFLGEVRAELSRVVWPKRDEFLEMLVAVGVVVAFFSVVLSGMDFGFSYLLRQLLS